MRKLPIIIALLLCAASVVVADFKLLKVDDPITTTPAATPPTPVLWLDGSDYKVRLESGADVTISPTGGGASITPEALPSDPATLVADKHYFADTFPATYDFTLPAAPSEGAEITVDLINAADSQITFLTTLPYRVGASSTTASIRLPAGNHRIFVEYSNGKWRMPDSGVDYEAGIYLGDSAGAAFPGFASTSAALAGALSDEQGTGALVFATSPTLTTPDIGAATGTSVVVSSVGSNIPIYTEQHAASHTVSAVECYGGVHYATAAATITLPPAVAGMSLTVVTVGAVAVSVDPDDADLLVLDGTALDDGDKATNTSTTGDVAVFSYYDATGWYVSSNAWTDGGP